MRASVSALCLLLAVANAQELCGSGVSAPIVATLDDGALFSNCATAEMGVQTRVSSLFDVLQFAAQDFLIFCRASNCLAPVRDLADSIPPNCLIKYHGSAHNLSKEVSALHSECVATNDAAEQEADDAMSRFFLDD
jgi:hypothetical protein